FQPAGRRTSTNTGSPAVGAGTGGVGNNVPCSILITRAVPLQPTAAGAITAVDTAAEIAALIQGSGNAFSLTSGGKAVIIAGESTGTNAGSFIYFVDDSVDGVAGTVSAADVVLVGTLGANYDVDTILTTNISFT
ncbi:MAG: hypothetical protein V4641_26320, partial [Pseudomonadota bacterium]